MTLRFSLRAILFLPLLAVPFQACGLQAEDSPKAPTFYKDVLPILQNHCLSCHGSESASNGKPEVESRINAVKMDNGMGMPFPLAAYSEARPHANQMADAVRSKLMPPWFADPQYGHFANDPSLTAEQIATIVAWAEAGAPAGHQRDAPVMRPRPEWKISKPDIILTMPKAVAIPAHGDVEYTYEIVPTHFREGKWVQMVELKPSSPQYMHHAVVYVRPPDSNWLRHAPVGVPFTASTLSDPQDRLDAHGTTSDLMIVYAPGSSPDQLAEGMAKFVPAGSDLVFQIHYTANGHAGVDQSRIGLVFSKTVPKQRVVTLQLNNHGLIIPPGADNFRVEVEGTLPNDATLLSLFPHMHVRGKQFEYDIVHPDGRVETLLRVHYHFHWQLSYKLAEPRLLQAGTKLRAVAWYDNSRANPHNPDPNETVTWGDQTYQEMMVGFFDVAIPAEMDKWKYFIRPSDGKR